MHCEKWLSIKGYEGLYEVSDHARVRSLDRVDSAGRNLKGKILKFGFDGNGYKRFTLSKNGKLNKLRVHRLMAIAFIPNPFKYEIVNHKDEDNTNNNLDNLQWCTHKFNISHSVGSHFSFVDPEGTIHRGVGINGFCKDNGLSATRMHEVFKGNQKSHRGWRLHCEAARSVLDEI